MSDDLADIDDDGTFASANNTPQRVSKETIAARLLNSALDGDTAQIFDGAGPGSDDLQRAKDAADLLVRAKFATFADEGRTELKITNAGRYWALHGGFLAYLKEEPAAAAAGGGGGARQRNPEMEALRAEYMKLRLGTFWWSFGLSIAGFLMSIISVAIALFYGDRLLR